MSGASVRAAAEAAAWLLLGIALAIATLATADAGQQILYAGGSFWALGGVSAVNVAAWNGADWLALGAGVGTTEAGNTGGVATLLQLGRAASLRAARSRRQRRRWLSGAAARLPGPQWARALSSGRSCSR